MYTVKQLSTLAGVTPRTLHHYDQIGLLKPESIGENGYRYYGEKSMLRLQQILFYRELDMPLDEIKKIMGRRDFDVLAYRRTNSKHLHVRGYKEKGNINTPLELAINNEIDRFSLAIDVIDRVPRLQVTGAHIKQKMRDRQIECRNYAHEYGVDVPEIRNWRWPY